MSYTLLKSFLTYPMKSWRNKYIKKKLKEEANAKRLLDAVVAEVAEYTNDTPAQILEKYHDGNFQRDGFFDNPEQLSVADVEKYYKEHTKFIYDLPMWNAEANRPKYLRVVLEPYLKRYNCCKLADFGGGTGDLCIEFASNGYDVTYCDVGEQSIDFAKWRFDRRSLSVTIAKGIEELSRCEEFDCVMSFDVFEHIKDLPATLKRLAPVVKKGGLLICSGAFESGDGAHLAENMKYDNVRVMIALLKTVGFSFVDKFAQYTIYQKL